MGTELSIGIYNIDSTHFQTWVRNKLVIEQRIHMETTIYLWFFSKKDKIRGYNIRSISWMSLLLFTQNFKWSYPVPNEYEPGTQA